MLLALGRAPQINYINISQEREEEEDDKKLLANSYGCMEVTKHEKCSFSIH
jgi:hypothetical protein